MKLPLSLKPADRQLIESVAASKGLTVSGWVRIAAVQASRAELEQRLRPSNTADGA